MNNSKCYCSCPAKSSLVRRKHVPVYKNLYHQASHDYVKIMCCSEERKYDQDFKPNSCKNIWWGEVVPQILFFSFLVLKAFVTEQSFVAFVQHILAEIFKKVIIDSFVITTLFSSLNLMYERTHPMPYASQRLHLERIKNLRISDACRVRCRSVVGRPQSAAEQPHSHLLASPPAPPGQGREQEKQKQENS